MEADAIVCSVDTIHFPPHWVHFHTSLFWDFWWIISTSSWFPTEFPSTPFFISPSLRPPPILAAQAAV